MENGESLYRVSTHEGDQLFLTEAAGRVFVQDVLGDTCQSIAENRRARLGGSAPGTRTGERTRDSYTTIDGSLLTESESGTDDGHEWGEGWRILVAPHHAGLSCGVAGE